MIQILSVVVLIQYSTFEIDFDNEEESISYFISSSTNHIDLIFNSWTLDFRNKLMIRVIRSHNISSSYHSDTVSI